MAFVSFSSAKKHPVRTAPPPPIMTKPSVNEAGDVSRLPVPRIMEGKKKCAPPRPPPPKQLKSLIIKAVKSQAPPVPLITKQQSVNLLNSAPPSSNLSTNDLLINWDSPPTSPSIARSSSDGLSLQSFGSDSSSTTASGINNPPRCESGFESETDSGWNEPSANLSAQFSAVASSIPEASKSYVMPTIIRPNRLRPAAMTSLSNPSHLAELTKLKNIPTTPRSSITEMFDADDGGSPGCDYSPPEPNIPPPVLKSWPPSDLAVDLFASKEAERREESQQNVTTALALFDYSSCHAGDLNFREGDKIIINKRVNEEWYEGRIGSHQGIFPVSFVEVIPPEQDSLATNKEVYKQSYEAVAMFPFQAETIQDLSLQEGDVLEVTETLGNGWLYGHRKGQSGHRGQFPEAFVQRTS